MAEEKEKMESKKEKSVKKDSWIKMKPAELEKIVIELAKQGESPAKIGLILRDKYGIPRAKLLGRKITKILKEKGFDEDFEKKEVEKKIEKLKEHLRGNKHDYSASRALTKRLWALNAIERRS